MNALYTKPPSAYHGLPVRTDWRVMAEFENGLFRLKPGGDEAFIKKSVAAFYPRAPQSRTEAWNGLLWFYLCGKPEPKPAASGRQGARPYDFEVDADLIYAAFRQAYGIDLSRTKMHWWFFRALFNALPETCALCAIMGYRTADTSDMKGETRQFYEERRAKYALPAEVGGDGLYAAGPRTQEEAAAEFIARLRRS